MTRDLFAICVNCVDNMPECIQLVGDYPLFIIDKEILKND